MTTDLTQALNDLKDLAQDLAVSDTNKEWATTAVSVAEEQLVHRKRIEARSVEERRRAVNAYNEQIDRVIELLTTLKTERL